MLSRVKLMCLTTVATASIFSTSCRTLGSSSLQEDASPSDRVAQEVDESRHPFSDSNAVKLIEKYLQAYRSLDVVKRTRGVYESNSPAYILARNYSIRLEEAVRAGRLLRQEGEYVPAHTTSAQKAGVNALVAIVIHPSINEIQERKIELSGQQWMLKFKMVPHPADPTNPIDQEPYNPSPKDVEKWAAELAIVEGELSSIPEKMNVALGKLFDASQEYLPGMYEVKDPKTGQLVRLPASEAFRSQVSLINFVQTLTAEPIQKEESLLEKYQRNEALKRQRDALTQQE